MAGRRCLQALILGLSLFAMTTPASTAPVVDKDSLMATESQYQVTQLVRQHIDTYHYRKLPLNDTLSETIYQRYLETLDPNRVFFIAADIEQFNAHRLAIDDYIRHSDLEPMFAIFSVFRSRMEQFMGYAQEYLHEDFDFSIDESYQFDRRESQWAKNTQTLQEIWRLQVKNDVLNLRLSGQEAAGIKETLQRRYRQRVLRVQQQNANDIFQYFINAYATSVEPHTTYFSPRSSDNFKIRMSLSLEGIGAVLQRENEFTLVRRVVKGGPADLSGKLHAGDRITGVGQGDESPVDIIGWRLDDVVDLIRGPKDSKVSLKLLPAGTSPGDQTKVIVLTRNRIRLEEQAAQKSLIEINEYPDESIVGTTRIGVIRVPTFYIDFEARAQGQSDYRSTTRDVRRLINELRQQQVDGVVVDLRGNGGGSLIEATTLTGLFIESGPIVQVRDSYGRIQVNQDPDPDIAYQGPLAVLVDRDSASASEIFAGAIQDYQRGLVIGETTFGKGTVQNLVNLDNYSRDENIRLGQLKMTIAQFFRIDGDSTQHKGVVPDIIFPFAFNHEKQGERSYDNALPWTRIESADYAIYQQYQSQDLLNSLQQKHQVRIKTDPGFTYLIERAERQFDNLKQQEISLMESERKAERQRREQEELARRNVLRRNFDLQPLVSLDAIADEDEDKIPDILLNEAANILTDFIVLDKHPRHADQNPNPLKPQISFNLQ